MNRPFYIIFQLFMLLPCFGVEAQSGFVLSKDIFGTRVFIENKGQFDRSIEGNQRVLYAYENGEERIYFTPNGLVYKLIKTYPLTEKQREEIEKGKPIKKKADKFYYVQMNWVNSNKQIQIVADQKQSGYFSYGGPQLNSYGYKKITYKNVYDHIDIEYIIPDNKDYGIKYNVILNPSANPGAIKILYSGDVKKIEKKGKEVVVKTPMGDITEHAPESFDDSSVSVSTSYTLNRDTLGFLLENTYNRNKKIIIDPWITTITTLTNPNDGYDVDYDNAGNLYVYGGGSPSTAGTSKIAKYSSTGVLLWTFSAMLTAQGWNTSGLSGIPGNFTVNKTTQKSYTGETFGAKIVRIDANGNYDNFITAATFFWGELWEFAFNPCTQVVYAFGGGTSFNRHAAIVDEVTATSIPVNLSGYTQTNQDVICCTIDDNGDLFLAFSVPAPNFLTTPNHLLKVNSGFTGNNWVQPTTYSTLLEYSNKPFFSNLPQSITAPSSNGFNCLAVNANYLYYYDGFNVAVFSKTTGTKTASATINGYAPLGQGGIAVDDCDNVYIGGNGVIHVFHFNGSAFVAMPSIPLGLTGPAQRVYDLKLDRATNLLYACGSKFVGTYSVGQICNISSQMTLSLTCGANNNATALVSVTPAIPGALLSYTWSGINGIISQTPNSTQTSNSLSNLANGTYTVYVQANAPCGPVSSQTFSVNCPLCSIVAGGSVSCVTAGIGFSLVAANPVNFSSTPSYTWSGPGSYTSILSQPSFTNGSFGAYTLTASNGVCTATALITLNALPTPSLSASASPTSGCIGKTVSLSAIAAGGTGPYTYTWTSGPSTAYYNISSTTVGEYAYTVSATDANHCKANNTIAISFNAAPLITVSSATACEGTLARLEASGADSYTWLPGGGTGNPYIFTASSAGLFTVVGSTKGCTNSATSTITVIKAPTASLTAFPKSGCEPLCINLSQVSTSPLVSYNWLINGVSIGTTSSMGEYCFKSPGNYVISFVGTDQSGCVNLPISSGVRVYKKPKANFIFSGEFTVPYAEVFYADASSANVTNWSWYFGDGESANDKNPKHVFSNPMIYTTFLVVETPEGCADTISKSVKIDELPLLFVPNSFTPNGDGKNDTFFAKGTGIRDFKLSIYDRWGEKIFETEDITKAWDGTYKGKTVQEGSYAWLIIYTLLKHRTETVAGHVNVLK